MCKKNMKNHEKLNSLRAKCAKNMNNYEKLNSLRAKWCSAHCPRHCHCSCTNCCGCCSNAFDNINDMQSLWNSDKNISKLQGRYESKFAKLRKHASRVYFALIHFGKIHFVKIIFWLYSLRKNTPSAKVQKYKSA